MKTTRSHALFRFLATFALAWALVPAAALAQSFTLTVTIQGDGAGFVSGSAFCGPDPGSCTASIGSGAQVNLSQFIGTNGNYFAGWSGCDKTPTGA